VAFKTPFKSRLRNCFENHFVLDFGASCVKLACAESCRVGVGPWEEVLVDKPSRFLYCLHAFASELTEDKPETIDSGHGRIDFSTFWDLNASLSGFNFDIPRANPFHLQAGFQSESI
jgi:hypothetical protein